MLPTTRPGTALPIVIMMVPLFAMGDDGPASPALQELATRLEAGDANAERDFWQSVERAGTPLVEELPDHDGHDLLTFLWRDEDMSRHRNVSVASRLYITHDDLIEPLTRLPDTHVWYRSERIPDRARLSYLFVFPQGRVPDPDAILQSESDGTVYEWFADPLAKRFTVKVEQDQRTRIPYLEATRAPAQPWIADRPSVARGQLSTVAIESRILGNTRGVTIYLPHGYEANPRDTYPYAVFFDREEFLTRIPLPTILDNMIAEGAIAPLVAILVGNVSPAERTRELLADNPEFRAFVTKELMPRMRTRYRLSEDPRHAVIGGVSAGGLTASMIALSHSDLFGNVLSQSGSYWWHPGVHAGETDEERLRAMGWLASRYIETPRLPLRFYLDVGHWEWLPMVLGNRHFRAALEAKGYDVMYSEFYGAHDYVNWRGTVSEGLVYLLADALP